jgi:hypothetical protein
MAYVIEFYVPARFKRKTKWVPEQLRGKVIAFPSDSINRLKSFLASLAAPVSEGISVVSN